MNITRLRELREQKQLKQIDIAKLLNITQQQYSEYELGTRIIPLKKLILLADYYNVRIDYFLSRKNKKGLY